MKKRTYCFILIFTIVSFAFLPESIQKKMGIFEIVSAETILQEPQIYPDENMQTGKKVTYDCIWFGSYPQTEIVDEASSSGVYGKKWGLSSDYAENPSLYNSLKNLDENEWDSNGDATIAGVKYRRIQYTDTFFNIVTDTDESRYFDWESTENYHYFRYEPIKWRVLEIDDSQILLLSDKVLDSRRYNETQSDVTWKESTIRSWLNGYSSPDNGCAIDYTKSNFINTAFSPEEEACILPTDLDNRTTGPYSEAQGCDSTTDKLYLLSSYDLYNGDSSEKYGFNDSRVATSPARYSRSSTYAKAMGVDIYSQIRLLDPCSWWLRSAGNDSTRAAEVSFTGSVDVYGDKVDTAGHGVRPALYLKPSALKYTYAGSVCTDGTTQVENEVFDTPCTYTVTYDANGGNDAPAIQTKVRGTNLKLRSSIPYRKGYKFLGWGTGKDSENISFYLGDTYVYDADITLYAVWGDLLYSVAYDYNSAGTISSAFDDDIVYIRGTGELEACYGGSWIDEAGISHKINEVYIEEGITSIGDNAFYGADIKKVHLPQSLVSIGEGAFGGDSSGVQEVNVPKTVKMIGHNAFSAPTLKKVDLEYGLKLIGGFQGSRLKKITIPDTVETIRKGTFDGCYIKEIEIPSRVKRIEDNTFALSFTEKIILHEGIEYIGVNAFADCTKLKYIKLPNSLITIKNGAFQSCNSLTEMTIPGNVKLDCGLFDCCANLEKITIEEGVTSIPDYFCYACDKLKTVSIPSTVKSVGKSAFEECRNLSYVFVPENVSKISSYAFGFLDNSSLAQTFDSKMVLLSMTYDNSMLNVASALSDGGHKKIANFVICGKPKTEAERYAKKYGFKFISEPNYKKKFTNKHMKYVVSDQKEVKCYGSDITIKTLKIPNTVTYKKRTYKVTGISGSAFKNNKKLLKVVLGKNIKVIGEKAFYNCSRIKSIKILTKGLKQSSIKAKAFKGTARKIKIIVPKKKKGLYKKILLKRGVNKKAKITSY